MAEIDHTKPIESVQAAISLFGEKSDHRKSRSSSSNELEKEKKIESLEKELANLRVHLETKEYACKQGLHLIDQHQKMADELMLQLICHGLEKEIYMNECMEAGLHLSELESRTEEMAGQAASVVKIQEQHLLVTSELSATRGQVLSLERELTMMRDEQCESLVRTEIEETASHMETARADELLRHIALLQETIMQLKLTADEDSKEKMAVAHEKEPVMQLTADPAGAVAEAQERLLSVQKQLDMMHSLENQLLEKSEFIYSLQLELHHANELHCSSQKAASNALCQLDQLRADLHLQERKNLDLAGYIDILETEFKKLKRELPEAKEEVSRLYTSTEQMKVELDKARSELIEIRTKETEAQVEIALLKCELHKGRSRMAAAEAAETRAQSEKSALKFALQQLAIAADEAKRENQLLKEASRAAQDSEVTYQKPPQGNAAYTDQTKMEPKREGDTDHIVISREEYGILMKKAQASEIYLDHVHGDKHELLILKKELEISTSKLSEFRTRAEQAISRAEAAEKAKAELEEQIKRRKEQRERRKAALAALREESIPREEISSINEDDNAIRYYQPLGKVLNMKF